MAGRLVVLGAGVCVLAATAYKAPLLLESLRPGAAIVAIATGAAIALAASLFALHGSARFVRRLACEVVALGVALIAVEVIIHVSNPTTWSDDLEVQRLFATERAARKQGASFELRSRSEVARELSGEGDAVLPGVGLGWASLPSVRKHLPPGFFPLSYASNTSVVECNEGEGYLRFRSGDYGFNNPSGLVAAGELDVAVIGESFALGHCVPPDQSAVAHVRRSYARTATFGIAGSRILSQLAIFREYVEPLRPRIVLWFVNPSYAEARQEADEPNLTRYVDPTFTQDLMHRQAEVDAAVRDFIVPLEIEQDRLLTQKLADVRADHWMRLLKLRNVRQLIDVTERWRRPEPELTPDFSYFEQTVALARRAVTRWGGRLIVVILPSYGDTIGQPRSLARYDALENEVRKLNVEFVDGVRLFRAQQDPLGLYQLRISNHPSERGHALMGTAIIDKIKNG